MPGGWRYIAQRAVSKEFVHWDVPLKIETLEWALSAPGALRGTVSPDVGSLRADDGGLVLDEWGTLLYAEHGGLIRWGGIVITSAVEGEVWRVEAEGFATYPHGIPYDGFYSMIGVDPADAFREIWRHLQSHTGGNLGVVVTGDSTPVRLGVPAVPAFDEYLATPAAEPEDEVWKPVKGAPSGAIIPSATAELAADITAAATSLALTAADNFGKIPLPFDITVGGEQITVTARSGTTLSGLTRGVGDTDATAHYEGTTVDYQGTETRTVNEVPAEPYLLAYYEAPDCGAEIDALVTETPFDFVEQHSWGEDNEILHEVRIGYPRLGRRRTDLSFVQGVNITGVVPVGSNGDEYANAVLGLGAGEGKEMLRRSTALVDGRLRRVHTYTDKGVSNAARLDALIADELNARKAALRITSIDVIDHPDTPLGSWEIGDDIFVRVHIPWLGEVAMWVRITAWAMTGEHTATLTVSRSDLFRYGG